MDNLNNEFFLVNFAIFYTNLIPDWNFWGIESFLKVTVPIDATLMTF